METNLKWIGLLILGITSLVNAQSSLPDWVTSTPRSGFWYYGIGIASREEYPDDFRDVARKNALKEIAQQIYVKIESSSNLTIDSYDRNTIYDYQDKTSTETITLLDGFEFVDDFYDTKSQEYWLLIRLNKEDFTRKKKEIIQKIETIGTQNLEVAKAYFKDGDYRNGITSLITIQDLMDTYQPLFPDNDFQVSSKGLEVDMQHTLAEALSDLEIVPMTPYQNVWEGADISVPFIVRNRKTGSIVNRIELEPEATGGVAKSYSVSSKDSVHVITLRSVHGLREEMNLYILPKIPVQLSADPRIKSKANSIQAVIMVKRFTAFMSTNEKNMGETVRGGKVARKLVDALREQNIYTTSSRPQADMELYVDVDTYRDGTDGFRYFAEMEIHVSAKDKEGNTLFELERKDLRGWGYSYDHAGRGMFLTLRNSYMEGLAKELADSINSATFNSP